MCRAGKVEQGKDWGKRLLGTEAGGQEHMGSGREVLGLEDNPG